MTKIANIALLEQPEQHVLSVRTTVHIKDLPTVIGQAYGKIAAFLAQNNELMADIPFVCYNNMDMENLDVEMGFPVAKPLSGNDEIKHGIIPSQKVITSIHMGAYQDSEPLYIEMGKWLADNGYEAKGPVYEYYMNDPYRPENELLTKIVMPVK